jgi:hypothetical protein
MREPSVNVRTLATAAAAALLAAELLAACGSSGSSGSVSPPAGSLGPASASAATTGTSLSGALPPSSAAPKPSGSGPVDVCGAIPLATVKSVTGRTVYTTPHKVDGTTEGAHLYGCEYTDSADAGDALDGFNVVVYRGGDTDKIMRDLAAALTSGASPQSGIGDRAQLGDGELDVVVGGDVVVVSDSVHEGDLAELTLAQFENLANRFMTKL